MGEVLSAAEIDEIVAGLRILASTSNTTVSIGLNKLGDGLERLKLAESIEQKMQIPENYDALLALSPEQVQQLCDEFLDRPPLTGVNIDNFWTAIVVAIVLSIFNVVVKPLLIILTLPATILTFGLFLFAINALILLLADYTVDGFEIDGFWWAILLSFLLSVLNSLMGNKDKPNTKKELN